MKLALSILTMALITYLIRMLPFTFIKKKITNTWLKSFLFYIPYTVLAAMTFPAIFSSTATAISAGFGLLVAVILAYLNKGLLTVALAASAAVFMVEWLLTVFIH